MCNTEEGHNYECFIRKGFVKYDVINLELKSTILTVNILRVIYLSVQIIITALK